ncbi:ER membrane glycoprotein subunit of the GPI transamidase complex-like protein [Microbotryomycetes sp. JL221]|nr:ER membrane glycoprotein subunit of the GPI transamidase complex-like protein [Microbotryomycetes sp. JL221]
MATTLARRPFVGLVSLSVLIKFIVMGTMMLTTRVGSFDASSRLIVDMPSDHLTAVGERFTRWDTVYFLEIARNGYTMEQQTAFMPGLPWLTRQVALTFETNLLNTGIALTALASTIATLCMYRLTLSVFDNRRLALATALIYTVPPSWPTFHAVPYTEPFAALFTLAGMLAFVHDKLVVASLIWAVGTLFRAQGIVLGVGFFGWKLLLRTPWRHGTFRLRNLLFGAPAFVALSSFSMSPFLAFQWYIRQQFCPGATVQDRRPWCDKTWSLPYDYVQSHYWNVGPFRYWTTQQLPNFLLASPVLIMSFVASIDFYRRHWHRVVQITLPFVACRPADAHKQLESQSSAPTKELLVDRITPFIHLNTALTLLLLVTAHVQIALRICVTNPVLFWFVAERFVQSSDDMRKSHSGRSRRDAGWAIWWTTYCIVWGSVSVVLWACFLPPA